MLLSRILRKFSYYFAVNKFQSIGLCIIITIIFEMMILIYVKIVIVIMLLLKCQIINKCNISKINLVPFLE